MEEWAAKIEELKPKVDLAMEAKDVPALEKALEGLDITTDDETLPMAFAALQARGGYRREHGTAVAFLL